MVDIMIRGVRRKERFGRDVSWKLGGGLSGGLALLSGGSTITSSERLRLRKLRTAERLIAEGRWQHVQIRSREGAIKALGELLKYASLQIKWHRERYPFEAVLSMTFDS